MNRDAVFCLRWDVAEGVMSLLLKAVVGCGCGGPGSMLQNKMLEHLVVSG